MLIKFQLITINDKIYFHIIDQHEITHASPHQCFQFEASNGWAIVSEGVRDNIGFNTKSKIVWIRSLNCGKSTNPAMLECLRSSNAEEAKRGMLEAFREWHANGGFAMPLEISADYLDRDTYTF